MARHLRHPGEVSGAAALIEAHTPGLTWLVGLFARWDTIDPEITRRWSFYVAGDPARPEALLCGEDGRLAWWGLVGDGEALEGLASQTPALREARRLSGEEGALRWVLGAQPGLDRRVTASSRVISMARRASPHDRIRALPPGYRRVGGADVERVLDLHEVSAHQPRAEALGVLRARAARGEVGAVFEEGRVVSVGEALRAGRWRDLQRIVTREGQRRRGFGRRLVEGLVVEAARAGQDTCLCVTEENDAARHLYEDLGFVARGVRLDLELGPPLRRA